MYHLRINVVASNIHQMKALLRDAETAIDAGYALIVDDSFEYQIGKVQSLDIDNILYGPALPQVLWDDDPTFWQK